MTSTDQILADASARQLASLSTKIPLLIAICCSAVAMPLTFTGPAVALPAIARSLGGAAGTLNPIALNWVTNAFMLSFGSCLLAAGGLADSYGRKRVFLIGLAAFTLISAALAFAPNILAFDLLRAVQGVGAAVTFSSGMAALAQEYDGTARMRAFSFVGASFGIGLAFGPIASGLMIESFGWPAIFALVVALGLISFLLAAGVMRESRDPAAAGLDWPGAILFTLALTLFTDGVLSAPEAGWGDSLVIALLIGAALLLTAFVIVERRSARPMLDLTLFRYPRFVGVQLLAAAPAYAFVVLLILLPIRFVGIEGMSAVAAGRMMIALSGPLLILPVIAGALTRWLSPAVICGSGLAIAAAGLFWLGHSSGDALIGPMLVIGLGISLPWGLMDGLAVSVVPVERAGMAAGIFATTRVAGEGVALAIVTVVLTAFTRGALPPLATAGAAAQRLVTGDMTEAARLLPMLAPGQLAAAYHQGFAALLWLLTAITLVTSLVVLLFLRQEATGEVSPVAAGLAADGPSTCGDTATP